MNQDEIVITNRKYKYKSATLPIHSWSDGESQKSFKQCPNSLCNTFLLRTSNDLQLLEFGRSFHEKE